MSEFDGARVGASLPALGFARAFGRWQRAHEEHNAVDAYLALSECLDWAHTLDEQFALNWRPRGKADEEPLWWGWRDDPAVSSDPLFGDTMRGLRYVRNRVHHHLADALEPTTGMSLPARLPARFRTFLWRDADELPTASEGKREAELKGAYTRVLAGSPVDSALGMMAEAFVFIGSLLDPPRPRPRPPVITVVQE